MRTRALIEADHEFDYDIPEIDDEALERVKKAFISYRVDPKMFNFARKGDVIVGKWRNHRGKISALRLRAIDIGEHTRDGRADWVWSLEWGGLGLERGPFNYHDFDTVIAEIMDDPVHCP